MKKYFKILLLIITSLLLSILVCQCFCIRVIDISNEHKITIFEDNDGQINIDNKYQNYLYENHAISKRERVDLIVNNIIFFVIILAIMGMLLYKKSNLLSSTVIFLFLLYILKIKYLSTIFLCLCFYLPYSIVFKNRKSVIKDLLTLLVFSISLIFIERFNFKITDQSQDLIVQIVHFTYYLFLEFVVDFVFNFIKSLKKDFYKRWLKYSAIFMIINIIVLLLIYPGNFVWDEMSILYCAENFIYSGWQSYLIVLIYSWSLMLIPFLVGIELFHIVVISFMFGYITSLFNEKFNSKLLTVLIFIVLSTPAVLMNNLYPLRHAILTVIEILFIIKLIFSKVNDEEINNEILKIWSLFIIIISFWRSENIYYLIAPLFILLIFNKKLNKQKILSFLVYLFLFILSVIPFKYLESNNPNVYTLTAFANPLSMMVQDKNFEISDKDYKSLDAVLDMKILKKHYAYNEVPAFKYGAIRLDYREHMSGFYKSYVRVVVDNFDLFIKYRFKTFLATNALDKKYVANSPWGIYEIDTDLSNEQIYLMHNNDRFSKAIDVKFRDKMIRMFKCIKSNSYTYNAFGKIFWNSIPMIILIFVYMIYYLFKKKLDMFLIFGLVVGKIPLVFATAPANYFFYYYSLYLFGLILIAYTIYKLFSKIWRNYEKK